LAFSSQRRANAGPPSLYSIRSRVSGTGQPLPIAIPAPLELTNPFTAQRAWESFSPITAVAITYLGRRPLTPRVVLLGDNPTNNVSPIVRIPSFPPSSTRTSWLIRLCSRKRLPSTTRASAHGQRNRRWHRGQSISSCLR
jgi:hypothetical protein